MRRLSLLFLTLVVAGLLLGACDFRREEEASAPREPPQQDSLSESGFIIYVHSAGDESLQYDVQTLMRANIDGTNQETIPLPDECVGPLDMRLNPNGELLALTCNVEGTPLGLIDLRSLEFKHVAVTALGAGFWSMDDEQFAYLERRPEPERFRLHILDADSGVDRDYADAPSWLVGWTPDNRLIFGEIYDACLDPAEPCAPHGEIFDPTTSEITRIANVQELGPLSPDGTRMLGQTLMNLPDPPPDLGGRWVGEVIDLRNDERRLISFENSQVFPVAWMSNEKLLVISVAQDTRLYVSAECFAWQLDGEDFDKRTLLAEGVCPLAHLSRDGSRLWFMRDPRDPTDTTRHREHELWVLDLVTGERNLFMPGVREELPYLIWEPP